MTYEVVQPPQFFEDRFIFLAAVILPLTLFRLHEKRWLILGLSFSLLSILLYDPLHSAFGMGYFDFDFESTEYYFSGNFYPLISYFFIVVGFLYIKIQQEGSEASLLKNKVEIESKNRKLTYQAKALEAQSEKLKATYDQLKELDEYKEATTAMIVHDFKNSLNTVISFSEGTPTKRQLKSIRQAGQFMLNMVMNMLDIQKYDSADIKLALGNYPISKVINEAINQLSYLIEQKTIKLTNDQNGQVWSRCDYELTSRVITNILSNAIKFVSNNGSIEIISSQKGDFVKLSIKDNGPGIPTDKIQLVFDKFAQINAKKSGSVRSTGIGLTFCKMVVEAHGGEIGVESEEGSGSTFWFTLPQVEASINDKEEKIDSTFVSQSELKLELTKNDRTSLQRYLVQLQQWEVYDFSEVKAILDTVESNKNSAIHAWLEEMNKAVQNVNEEMYLNLIKIRET